MRKSLLSTLTLSAALSFVPAGLALAAPLTEAPMSSASYSPLYTESSWMTLNVPVAALGGTIPSDLALSAAGLPDGTSITLVGVSQEGDQAVLTVSVQRTNTDNFINATSLIKLTSGTTTLTSFNVPVVGTAYTSGS